MFYASGMCTVDIPEGVTNIGTQAFHHSNICELTIPSNVVNIGAWAFYECKDLRHLVIPGSVTNIGNDAFADCNGSATLMFEGLPPAGIDEANIPKTVTIFYDFDLSINKYKKVEYVAETFPPTADILRDIDALADEFVAGVKEIKKLVDGRG